jgi:TrmH family RNA methyltransferase
MTLITSLQNPRVKLAIKLRDRRQRQRYRRILIDGVRELSRAIAAGVELLEVFRCPSLGIGNETQQVLDGLPNTAEVFQVTSAVFEKLAFGSRAEGVLGVARMPEASLEKIVLPENPLVVVLEGVEKPGNIGAVARTADASGSSALVVADSRTDLFNPNAIRASLGTIFRLPMASATTAETLAWLRRQRLSIFAARVDGSTLYTDVDFKTPSAVVLGSEAHGLSSAWSGDDVQAIRLPMLGVADSLNVSATAAVLCYEAWRSRQPRAV